MVSHTGFDVIPGSRRTGPDPIAALQAVLRRYPQVLVQLSPTRVQVEPLDAGGFPVTLEILPTGHRVGCGEWHQDVPAAEDAIAMAKLALSPAARLAVTVKGGLQVQWELQRLDPPGSWIGLGALGAWLVPFWGRRTVHYLQNRLLEAA